MARGNPRGARKAPNANRVANGPGKARHRRDGQEYRVSKNRHGYKVDSNATTSRSAKANALDKEKTPALDGAQGPIRIVNKKVIEPDKTKKHVTNTNGLDSSPPGKMENTVAKAANKFATGYHGKDPIKRLCKNKLLQSILAGKPIPKRTAKPPPGLQLKM